MVKCSRCVKNKTFLSTIFQTHVEGSVNLQNLQYLAFDDKKYFFENGIVQDK